MATEGRFRPAFPPQGHPREGHVKSAPKTNIETQKRRHRGPLVGMATAVIFGFLLITYWIFEEAANGENPQQPKVPTDSDE